MKFAEDESKVFILNLSIRDPGGRPPVSCWARFLRDFVRSLSICWQNVARFRLNPHNCLQVMRFSQLFYLQQYLDEISNVCIKRRLCPASLGFSRERKAFKCWQNFANFRFGQTFSPNEYDKLFSYLHRLTKNEGNIFAQMLTENEANNTTFLHVF